MISSVQNQTIKNIAKLQQKKYRDETGTFIIEGEHGVYHAKKNNLLKHVFATKPYNDYLEATLVSDHVMKKMTDTKTPPSIIAVCKQITEHTVHDHVLILEHIQDPGNLGTLIRTALAFNYKTIILDDCVDVYNAKVLRSTQGALFDVSILKMQVKAFHKHYPHTLIAADLSNEAYPAKIAPPFAIILGNEGQGLKKETIALSRYRVTIPIENIDSLNVGIAGGILMHQFKADKSIK